ncbi:hypothetical protein DPM19_09790 [Actinomadura craniellae]|uniref:Uncharacterized protein n=1 Tax=Actinomadura craniellae TaxID=2231787 RepID=A0A365H7K7_9ACTN|nr:hypothetical protein [Actinomadura craniellae]RAY15029.1 hypothetical protein DPM19_09790 [Actinomadura craniellae]
MSSTLLYLAIVAVWAVVLVPMWLRRDTEVTGFSRLRARRTPDPDATLPGTAEQTTLPETVEQTTTFHAEPYEDPTDRPRRRVSRATVIARRRRRTFGLLLLLCGSLAAVLTRLIPWWAIAPSIVLFTAHLALLRVAAGIDTARRRAALAARAEARAQARAAAQEEAERAREAEVLDFVLRTREVFDQYADDRRAVGD